MTNHDEQHRHELLLIHRRNARRLEQQIAQYGLETPIHLLNALDHERREIARIKASAQQQQPQTSTQAANTPTLADTANTAIQPYRSSLSRSRPASIMRSMPRFRHIAWRTKISAAHYWQAGAVTFALVVVLLALLLWRPAANPVLVDELRSDAPATVAQTIILDNTTIEPAQIEARTGGVIALTISNRSATPQRWFLFDGDIPIAQTLLANGLREQSLIRRETELIAPETTLVLTFVPPHAGSYSFTSISENGTASTWGVIEVRDPEQ